MSEKSLRAAEGQRCKTFFAVTTVSYGEKFYSTGPGSLTAAQFVRSWKTKLLLRRKDQLLLLDRFNIERFLLMQKLLPFGYTATTPTPTKDSVHAPPISSFHVQIFFYF